jgi:Ca-activated chloride channel family protein
MSRVNPVVVLFAAAGAVVSAQPDQQTPVFTARQDVVRLDVLVTDRSRPVLDLKAADFTVLDNGVPQRVDYLSFDELPLNVVLNFDVSGSMTGQRLDDLRSAGHAVLDQLRARDRAAVVSFTQAVALQSELTGEVSRLKAALDATQAGGETSIVDASLAGLVVAASNTGRSLMLAFSDGVDTSSFLRPASVIDTARRTDVVVFGVSAGKLRAPFLKDIADMTGGDVVEVQSTRELRNTLVRILNEYRQRYLIAYSPSGVPTSGWHTVKVSVARSGATIKARQGYQR